VFVIASHFRPSLMFAGKAEDKIKILMLNYLYWTQVPMS